MDSIIVAMKNSGVLASNFGTLAAAINAAEADTAHVNVPPKYFTLTATDTLRRTAAMYVQKGARINIASGVTFHIRGHFYAGNYKVFEGSGSVVFGNESVDRVNAAWFGAESMSEAGGDSVDNVTAIRKAITTYNASITGQKRQDMEIYLPPGIYHISDSLLFQYHDTVINFEGKLRPYGTYARYLVVINGDNTTRSAKTGTQFNRARLSVKRLRLDGLHQSKGLRIEDMMHAQLNEIHCERIEGTAFKCSRFKESVITNLNIHTSAANTDSALLWIDGETGSQDANNGLVFLNPKIEYSGGRYVYMNTGASTLPRNIDFISPQFHHLDVTAENEADGIDIDSTGIGDVVVDIVRGNDIRFFGGNIRIPASPRSRCIRLGYKNSSSPPQRLKLFGTILSNTTTTGGMGLDIPSNNSGAVQAFAVQNDVTSDSLWVSPQVYRVERNNSLALTSDTAMTSTAPLFVVSRVKAQGSKSTPTQIADTSAIAINVDKDVAPYLEFYSSTGGQGRITISGASGSQVMQFQQAIRYNFDSTLTASGALSIGSTGPKHEVSVYNATPRLALTDTDVNKNRSTAAQAQDSAAIAFDASTTTPTTIFKNSVGQTVLNFDSNGNLGIGTAITPTARLTVEGGISIGDTTGFVLTAPGAATISTESNVVLDTFGAVAADTAVTLTGVIGQVVYIKTRNSSRDITFLDAGNFLLGAERVLTDVADVLVLQFITATSAKEIYFGNNN